MPCQLGVDVTFLPWGVTAGEIDAPVVFAGYGQVNPAEKIDDYDGIDVKGRFVLDLHGPAARAKTPAADRRSARRLPAAAAGRFSMRRAGEGHRAQVRSGSIVIRGPGCRRTAIAELPRQPMALFGFGQPSMTLGQAPDQDPDPVVRRPDPRPDREGDRARRPIEAQGSSTASASASSSRPRKRSKEDRNVIGLFPGSDPEKAKEVVIYSAHYDHVGVDDKGEIYNGSDDNASGTSALLEIAEAFGDGPRPARSVAFLWVSGEEKGLLGSQWFSDHITLPEGYKIVADINLDMVSRNDGKTIGITPSDKHADYSTLIPAAMRRRQGRGAHDQVRRR